MYASIYEIKFIHLILATTVLLFVFENPTCAVLLQNSLKLKTCYCETNTVGMFETNFLSISKGIYLFSKINFSTFLCKK